MNVHNAVPAYAVHDGMGAIPHEAGTAFRVWGPNAACVAIVGDFSDWTDDAAAMTAGPDGNWYVDVPSACAGQECRFRIEGSDGAEVVIRAYAALVYTR